VRTRGAAERLPLIHLREEVKDDLRLESRRAFAVVALACLTFLFILFELVAHAYLH